MATDYHTAIGSGSDVAAVAATFNTPLAALDAAIGLGGGGAAATAAVLKGWAEAGAYELTAITWDSDNVPTTATVKWPDSGTGTFTTTTKNTTWMAIDAYTITHTHTAVTLTVTQAAVTRDPNTGSITAKPPLTVA